MNNWTNVTSCSQLIVSTVHDIIMHVNVLISVASQTQVVVATPIVCCVMSFRWNVRL